MAVVPVQCPQCQGIHVVKYGKQANGAQRYRCNNADCPRHIFLLQYHDTGRLPEIKQRIVDLTLNGCGVRDIVRVLRVSSATVVNTRNKRPQVSNRSTSNCSKPSPLSRRGCGSQWELRQSSTRCGAVSATKRRPDGYGMPSITTPGRY
jgi:transposase-like protein